MGVTLKDTVTEGNQSTKYTEWSPSRPSTSAPGSELPEQDAPKKKSKFSQFLNAAKNALLSGFLGNNPYATGTRYYGDGEAYTAGNETVLPVGRSVGATAVQKRFRLGNEWGSGSNNEVFVDGFEDPTFLTFKIEFGEWGASLCDNSTIASILSNSVYNNTWLMNYDVMPMGLLDLNFLSDFRNFNKQETYNAYNYLMNRNEDRRAEYIKDFVEGLYAVQRDFPYIFQKINGINKLEAFEANQGQRLKDCVLKLSCINDGLDMKMRTLLELYRKAAWDDEYQRWQLPDIHRYFKMILYVFDHRAIAMGNGEFSPDNEYLPIIAYECGPCEFVIDSWSQPEYSVNYNELKATEPTIDIKVYNVRTFYSNKMFQRVKYINDMWTRDLRDNGMSRETTDASGNILRDRAKQTDGDATFSDGRTIAWQYVWLQRMFMQPDEWSMGATWNESTSTTASTHYHADSHDFDMIQQNTPLSAIDQQYDNTWHFATVSDEAYAIRSFSDLWGAVKSIITQRTQLVRDSRTSNRYYFVNDLTRIWYYLDHGMFNMVNIDTEGAKHDIRRRIRDMIRNLREYAIQQNLDKDSSVKDPSYSMNLDKQKDIEYIDFLDSEQPEQELTTIDTLTDIPEQELYAIIKDLTKADMDLTPINEADGLPEQELTKLILNPEHAEMTLTPLELNLIKELMDLFPLELNTEHRKMEMTWLLLNLEQLQQTLQYIHKNEEHAIMHMQDILQNLFKPEMNMTWIIQRAKSLIGPLSRIYLNIAHPDMELAELDFNLKKYEGPLSEIIMNLDHMQQNLAQLMIDLSNPDMNLYPIQLNLAKDIREFVELIKNLSKDEMTFYELIKNLDIPEQKLAELLKNLDKKEQTMTEILPNLEKMIQNLTGIEKNLEIPEQELTEINKNLDILQQELTELLVNEDKPEQELINIELNEAKPKVVMVAAEQNTDKPMMEMVQSYPLESKIDMNETPIIQNTEHFNADLQTQYVNTDKPKMEMISQDQNMDVVNAQMSPIEQNLLRDEMQMTPLEQNLLHGEMSMTELEKNASLGEMSMPGIVRNVSIGEMKLTEQKRNLEQTEMNMTDIEQNVSLGEMRFTELEKNTSLGEMKLTEQYINTERIEQDMSGLKEPDEPVVLPMTRLKDSSYVKVEPTIRIKDVEEIPEMKMNELKETLKSDVSIADIELRSAEPGEMKMAELKQNTEIKHQPMTELKEPEEMQHGPMTRLKEPEEVQHSPMTELKKSEEIIHQPMSGLEEPQEIQHSPMSGLEMNTDKGDMRLSELEMNTEVIHGPMTGLTEQEYDVNLKMQSLVDIEKTPYEIHDSEVKEDEEATRSRKETHRQSLNQGPKIIDTDTKARQMLMSKIEMLQSLDVNSLENASLEQLVKLFKIIEDTTNQARREMKMQEIQTSSKTGKTMTMTGIKQEERSQFLAKRIQDPGREAYERAEAAYARAHPNKNNTANKKR